MHDGFQANPEGLIQKGKNISTIYNGYIEQKEEVNNIAERVERAWTGADSTGYITSIRSYDKDFQEMGEVIEKIGDIIYRHGLRLTDSRDAIQKAATRL